MTTTPPPLYRTLACSGCGHAILLPFEKLAQALAFRGVRTNDKEPIAAVCNYCKKLRNYDLAKTTNDHAWGLTASRCIGPEWEFLELLECEDNICKSRLPLFAMSPHPRSIAEWKEFASAWDWNSLQCQEGHPILQPQ